MFTFRRLTRNHQLIIFFVLTLYFAANDVTAQRPGIGSCPVPATLKEFDVKEFQGLWYEVERTFYIFETVANCASFNFSLNDDGTLNVIFSMKNRLTGNLNSFNGKALPHYLDHPSVMEFRLSTRWTEPSTSYWSSTRIPNALSRMLPGSGTYYILSTDYANYAIMWSCSEMGILHSDLVWVLGRTRDFNSEQREIIYKELEYLNIDPQRLVLTKHKDCP